MNANVVSGAFQEQAPAVSAFQASRGDWFLLHTKSRQEKALGEFLIQSAIPFFLPLVRHVRHYGHRKEVVDAPLFPGYVFLRGSRDEAFEADRTKRVVRIITVADQLQLTNELRAIALSLAGNVPLDPFPFLRQGQRVRVRSGPMAGACGMIDRRSKNNRIILQVTALGSAVALEIDAALLDVEN